MTQINKADRLYVSNNESGTISVIEIDSNQVLTEIIAREKSAANGDRGEIAVRYQSGPRADSGDQFIPVASGQEYFHRSLATADKPSISESISIVLIHETKHANLVKTQFL
ncbi:MAG: hypothetical protein E2O57_04045 [Gammaproteobacteria bacterium]|nr:MAG: hypothetical protein E2O57_04045 [Gammaproteobacteria bacterium]